MILAKVRIEVDGKVFEPGDIIIGLPDSDIAWMEEKGYIEVKEDKKTESKKKSETKSEKSEKESETKSEKSEKE